MLCYRTHCNSTVSVFINPDSEGLRCSMSQSGHQMAGIPRHAYVHHGVVTISYRTVRTACKTAVITVC